MLPGKADATLVSALTAWRISIFRNDGAQERIGWTEPLSIEFMAVFLTEFKNVTQPCAPPTRENRMGGSRGGL